MKQCLADTDWAMLLCCVAFIIIMLAMAIVIGPSCIRLEQQHRNDHCTGDGYITSRVCVSPEINP